VASKDWARWHEQYDDPASPLSVRLALVRAHLANAITAAPPGTLRLVSLCAGQGHDVIGVLPVHPRRDDVTAVLVEADARNAGLARERAAQAGLTSIEVRQADAGLTANYADALPADVLLLCGIFGNVSPDDIHATATAAAPMCRPGGTVIWTRHRRAPDLTPLVRSWFAEAGFDEVAFERPATANLISVGVHRLSACAAVPATALAAPADRLFTFLAS